MSLSCGVTCPFHRKTFRKKKGERGRKQRSQGGKESQKKKKGKRGRPIFLCGREKEKKKEGVEAGAKLRKKDEEKGKREGGVRIDFDRLYLNPLISPEGGGEKRKERGKRG